MLTLLATLWLSTARATLDPLSGARVSLATTQQMLAAPFLPNLTTDRGHLGVQAVYLRARLAGTERGETYRGRFEGAGFGASYSKSLRRDVGYFVTGVYSQSDGRASIDNDVRGESTHRFSTAGVVANVGGSLRVFGRDGSTSIVGIFGGPAVMQFDSRLRIDDALYASSPFIYGVTAGLQWRLQFGNFVVNPYALRFEAFTNACTGVDSSAVVTFDDHCPGDESKVALMPSFNAYGLVLGYRRFEANVYAKLLNDAILRDITVMNLGLSYTF